MALVVDTGTSIQYMVVLYMVSTSIIDPVLTDARTVGYIPLVLYLPYIYARAYIILSAYGNLNCGTATCGVATLLPAWHT